MTTSTGVEFVSEDRGWQVQAPIACMRCRWLAKKSMDGRQRCLFVCLQRDNRIPFEKGTSNVAPRRFIREMLGDFCRWKTLAER